MSHLVLGFAAGFLFASLVQMVAKYFRESPLIDLALVSFQSRNLKKPEPAVPERLEKEAERAQAA